MNQPPAPKPPRHGRQYLSLIVAHLNASTGPILTEGGLEYALRTGSVRGRATDPPGGDALVASLFVEEEPRLIVLAAREVRRFRGYFRISEAQIETLYQNTLSHGAPHVREWERAFAQFE